MYKKKHYHKIQEEIPAAANLGLVDLQVSESDNNITIMIILITITSAAISISPKNRFKTCR